eukprot:2699862-Rhodomonas_salina.2
MQSPGQFHFKRNRNRHHVLPTPSSANRILLPTRLSPGAIGSRHRSETIKREAAVAFHLEQHDVGQCLTPATTHSQLSVADSAARDAKPNTTLISGPNCAENALFSSLTAEINTRNHIPGTNCPEIVLCLALISQPERRMLPPKVKYKKPHFQHKLYKECGFLYLSLACTWRFCVRVQLMQALFEFLDAAYAAKSKTRNHIPGTDCTGVLVSCISFRSQYQTPHSRSTVRVAA